MKIIEGLKKVNDLARKAEDLVQKVSKNCALSSLATPEYGDSQQRKVQGWIQSHSDVVKEILRLRVAIQKTNIETTVTIEIGGKSVTKSIAEWIHRRRDLANMEKRMWASLGDRGIQEGVMRDGNGDPVTVKLARYYDPELRDEKLELFSSEPGTIDARLEVVNAITDLIE